MIFELAHELLPYAAALYVFDSVVRARPGERLIASAWGRRFRWRGPGWHLVGLLPVAEAFVVPAPPSSADRVPPPSPADRIPPASSDDRAAPSAPTPAPSIAAASAATIAAASAPSIAAASAATHASLPPAAIVEAIRTRRAAHARDSRAIAVAGAVVLAATFVALPLAVYRPDPTPRPAEAAVAAAAIGWAAVVVLGARSLRRSGLAWGATLSALSPALFFPPAAAHALSFLRRDAFRSAAPLAVAAVLLPQAEFRRLARRELRALDEVDRRARDATDVADQPEVDPAATAIAVAPATSVPATSAPARVTSARPADADTRAARAEILALLTAAGIDPREAVSADAPRDSLAALFCPLCETEYRSGFATCADCDAALIPFAPAVTR